MTGQRPDQHVPDADGSGEDETPQAPTTPNRVRQHLVTLDLEGVLIPEIWIGVAEATGVEGLRRTTRDEPNYDTLMRYRLDLLEHNGIRASDVFDVIANLGPLPGARAFLDTLRSEFQVIILSDTFEQFAAPLMPALGMPTVFCHTLDIAEDRIVGYQLRQPDQKRHAVAAFQGLNYVVAAAGDSYNDTSMLQQANAGFLFRAPDRVKAEFPQFQAIDEYDDLLDAFRAHAHRTHDLIGTD